MGSKKLNILTILKYEIYLRTAARLPAGFTLRQYGRKNILFSNDFVCVVKRK